MRDTNFISFYFRNPVAVLTRSAYLLKIFLQKIILVGEKWSFLIVKEENIVWWKWNQATPDVSWEAKVKEERMWKWIGGKTGRLKEQDEAKNQKKIANNEVEKTKDKEKQSESNS